MEKTPDNKAEGIQKAPQSTVTARKRPGPDMKAEQLVRDRVGKFFENRQFDTKVAQGTDQGIDVECLQYDLPGLASREHWIIEAKGWKSDSTNRGDSFIFGLGEIMQLTRNPKEFPPGRTIFYGFAMPDHKYYWGYCAQVSEWACQQLSLHWIWVPIDETFTENHSIPIKLMCPPGCTCGFSQQSLNQIPATARKRKHIQL